jgi:two-component system invasion response regulator UvrY
MVRNPADASIGAVGVVVVDDQAPFRQVASAVVGATAGFTLLGEAACGEDALRVAARVHPDLMLVDVRMPGISGFETSARLACLRPRPCVILISGDEGPVLSELACSHDALGFLPKRALTPRTLQALWELHGGSKASEGADPRSGSTPGPTRAE